MESDTAPPIVQTNYVRVPRGVYIYPVEALAPYNSDYGFTTLRHDPDNRFIHLFQTVATTQAELEALNFSASGKLAMTSNVSIGKLSPKVEAAGKLRIFAMVDI